jgi:hypothetical protein
MGLCLDDGGLPVTAYSLYVDGGSWLSDYTLVYSGMDLVQTVAGLTPGLEYHFTTTATNSLGESDFST